MSVSMWSYRPEVCDGGGCPGDCDLCDKPKNMEDEPTDYISRQAVVEFLDSNNMPWRDWVNDIPSADVVSREAYEQVKMQLEAMTTDRMIDNGTKQGEWIIHGKPPMYVIECPECGQKFHNHEQQTLPNFCSECGAKMKNNKILISEYCSYGERAEA